MMPVNRAKDAKEHPVVSGTTRRGFTSGLGLNAAYLGAAAIVGRLSSIALIIALFRGAGPQGAGEYALATLFGSAVGFAIALGMSTYATREYAGGQINRTDLSTIFLFRAIGAALGGMILAAVMLRLEPTAWIGMSLIAWSAIVDQVSEIGWAVTRAGLRSQVEAGTNAIVGTLSVTLAVLLIALLGGMTLTQVGIAQFSLSLFRAIVARLQLGKHQVDGRPQRTLRVHISKAFPYCSTELLGLIYLRGDVAVLGSIVSATELGYYAAASTLITPLIQVGAAINILMLSQLTKRASTASIRKESALLARLSFSAGLFVASILIGLMLPIVNALYSTGTQEITVLAVVMALFLPLRYLDFGLSNVLLAKGRVWQRFGIVLIAALSTVGLNLWLVPDRGVIAAAWLCVATEGIVLVSYLVAIQERPLVVTGLSALVAIALLSTLTNSLLCSSLPVSLSVAVISLTLVAASVTNGRRAWTKYKVQTTTMLTGRIAAGNHS